MTGAAFTPSDLFNCCTHGTAPDWSQFDALEIGGCVDTADDEMKARGETYFEGGYDRAEAEIFTVYAHYKEGHTSGFVGSEAVTDCESFERAEAVAAELSRLSGLPVNVFC